LVNSKTENRKTFEGNSQARKGKITAKDNWIDQKEQGSLTSYFNQPAARALTRLRASPQACSWRFSGLDGSPWSCVGGVPVAFPFVGINAVSLRRCCSCLVVDMRSFASLTTAAP